MKYKKIVLGLLTICATSTLLNAASSWTSGAYTNNENITENLEIDGAQTLIVNISGETERNYDFLSIVDSNGTEIKKLSGPMNESFEVSGSLISVHFTSDYSVTKSGVTVSITSKDDNETEQLILNPRKDTVLTHGSIRFEVKEGVNALYYSYVNVDDDDVSPRMPIKNQNFKWLDTTQGKIKVCAVKDINNPKPSCIVYDIERYDPFDVKHNHGNVTFKNATYLYMTHTASAFTLDGQLIDYAELQENGIIPNYDKYFTDKNVSGQTDWGLPYVNGDNAYGAYAVQICGYVSSKWTCQVLAYGTFPM